MTHAGTNCHDRTLSGPASSASPAALQALSCGWNDVLLGQGFPTVFDTLRLVQQQNYELGRLVAAEALASARGTAPPPLWLCRDEMLPAFEATICNTENLATVCCPVPASLRPQAFIEADARRRAAECVGAAPIPPRSRKDRLIAFRQEQALGKLGLPAWLVTPPRLRPTSPE
jgi:hypothetical protein